MTPKPPSEDEAAMRVERTRLRIIRRKLKQGRPGRYSNEPMPDFDWGVVVAHSQKHDGHA